jgi:transposase
MGPVAAKSYPGGQWVQPQAQAAPPQPAGRARQEADYGRRGKGYSFGAFQPGTGAAHTTSYERRTSVNFVAFLEQVENWLPVEAERVYAIMDNLAAHKGSDVLLFSLAHPRWEFVFTPTAAAYLNLIEPWWKNLRSLALKGRRFETWPEVEAALRAGTAYWNQHKHPFIWGRRRRHRLPRRPSVAALPKAA